MDRCAWHTEGMRCAKEGLHSFGGSSRFCDEHWAEANFEDKMRTAPPPPRRAQPTMCEAAITWHRKMAEYRERMRIEDASAYLFRMGIDR